MFVPYITPSDSARQKAMQAKAAAIEQQSEDGPDVGRPDGYLLRQGDLFGKFMGPEAIRSLPSAYSDSRAIVEPAHLSLQPPQGSGQRGLLGCEAEP